MDRDTYKVTDSFKSDGNCAWPFCDSQATYRVLRTLKTVSYKREFNTVEYVLCHRHKNQLVTGNTADAPARS